METIRLNGRDMRNLLMGGAQGLRANMEEINDLNVFPVPDGDTGINMTKTLEGGLARLQAEELRTVYRDRTEAFVAKLENKLMQSYESSENSTERRMTATFMISGMSHVLGQWLLSDEGKRIDMSTIAAYMERMTRSMLPITT